LRKFLTELTREKRAAFFTQKIPGSEDICYTHATLNRFMRGERAEGIEPSCVAWKATVLPLNYAREVTSPDVAMGRG
jgi:hypothetical protein